MLLPVPVDDCDTFKVVRRRHFPDPNRLITTTCRQQGTRRVPGNAFDLVVMALRAHDNKMMTAIFHVKPSLTRQSQTSS